MICGFEFKRSSPSGQDAVRNRVTLELRGGHRLRVQLLRLPAQHATGRALAALRDALPQAAFHAIHGNSQTAMGASPFWQFFRQLDLGSSGALNMQLSYLRVRTLG